MTRIVETRISSAETRNPASSLMKFFSMLVFPVQEIKRETGTSAVRIRRSGRLSRFRNRGGGPGKSVCPWHRFPFAAALGSRLTPLAASVGGTMRIPRPANFVRASRVPRTSCGVIQHTAPRCRRTSAIPSCFLFERRLGCREGKHGACHVAKRHRSTGDVAIPQQAGLSGIARKIAGPALNVWRTERRRREKRGARVWAPTPLDGALHVKGEIWALIRSPFEGQTNSILTRS